MKRFLLLMLCGAVLLGLCSCGVKSAQELGTAAPVDTEFVSDDGTIRVRLHGSDADDIPAAMPVLRARPQVITLGMARRMAKGVFGDAEFFEFSEELSKAEIADMISVYEYAVTDEAIRAAHGDAPQAWIDSVRDARLNILEYYRNAYAAAREEVTPVPCLWRFWPVEHYSVHGHDYAGTDPSYTDDIPAGVSVDLRAVTTVAVCRMSCGSTIMSAPISGITVCRFFRWFRMSCWTVAPGTSARRGSANGLRAWGFSLPPRLMKPNLTRPASGRLA